FAPRGTCPGPPGAPTDGSRARAPARRFRSEVLMRTTAARPWSTRPLVAAVAVLAVLGSAGCGSKGGRTIPVGVYGATTGTTATFGKSTRNGAQMAADELNAAGGVGGKKIDLRPEDDQSKADEAATAVQKLINQDRAVALIGEVASSRSLAAAPIAQQNGVPM